MVAGDGNLQRSTKQAHSTAKEKDVTESSPQPAKRGTRREDDVVVTVSLPKAVHEELRRLQYEQRRPIHGMILTGIAMFLQAEDISTDV